MHARMHPVAQDPRTFRTHAGTETASVNEACRYQLSAVTTRCPIDEMSGVRDRRPKPRVNAVPVVESIIGIGNLIYLRGSFMVFRLIQSRLDFLGLLS
jgi:hypothetical protein